MGKENGNGHDLGKVGVPQHIKQTLSQSQLKPLFGQHELPNALNMLVQPGEDYHGILMRTVFEDSWQRQATIDLIELDNMFGYDAGKELALMNCAAAVSDFGIGREQLVKAIIGEANLKNDRGGFGSWLKKKAGFKDDDKD